MVTPPSMRVPPSGTVTRVLDFGALLGGFLNAQGGRPETRRCPRCRRCVGLWCGPAISNCERLNTEERVELGIDVQRDVLVIGADQRSLDDQLHAVGGVGDDRRRDGRAGGDGDVEARDVGNVSQLIDGGALAVLQGDARRVNDAEAC